MLDALKKSLKPRKTEVKVTTQNINECEFNGKTVTAGQEWIRGNLKSNGKYECYNPDVLRNYVLSQLTSDQRKGMSLKDMRKLQIQWPKVQLSGGKQKGGSVTLTENYIPHDVLFDLFPPTGYASVQNVMVNHSGLPIKIRDTKKRLSLSDLDEDLMYNDLHYQLLGNYLVDPVVQTKLHNIDDALRFAGVKGPAMYYNDESGKKTVAPFHVPLPYIPPELAGNHITPELLEKMKENPLLRLYIVDLLKDKTYEGYTKPLFGVVEDAQRQAMYKTFRKLLDIESNPLKLSEAVRQGPMKKYEDKRLHNLINYFNRMYRVDEKTGMRYYTGEFPVYTKPSPLLDANSHRVESRVNIAGPLSTITSTFKSDKRKPSKRRRRKSRKGRKSSKTRRRRSRKKININKKK